MAIKSGETINFRDLDARQASIGDQLNNGLSGEQIERGALGREHIDDSVLLCSRNVDVTGTVLINKHIAYPETAPGPHWGSPAAGDSGHSWNWHMNERVRWREASNYASVLSTTEETDGYGAAEHWYIGNDGEPFSILFYLNAEIVRPLRWDKTEWKSSSRLWTGTRFWTSVVYRLKINQSAPSLEWSPDYMLGSTAAEYNKFGFDETGGVKRRRGISSHTTIGSIHAYQDIQFINQDFIDRLATMNGYIARSNNLILNAGLGPASFGWRLMAGSDRWDGTYNDPVDDLTTVGSVAHFEPLNGSAFHLGFGNVGFTALRYDGPNPIAGE